MSLRMNFSTLDIFLIVFRLECQHVSMEQLKFVVLLRLYSSPTLQVLVYSRLVILLINPLYLIGMDLVISLHSVVQVRYCLLLLKALVYSELVMKQILQLSRHILVLVHSEKSVVQQNLLPSIHWRSRCSSPLLVLVDSQLSHWHTKEKEIYLRLMVVVNERQMLGLVLVVLPLLPRNQDLMNFQRRNILRYTILTLIVINQNMIMVHWLTLHLSTVLLPVD